MCHIILYPPVLSFFYSFVKLNVELLYDLLMPRCDHGH